MGTKQPPEELAETERSDDDRTPSSTGPVVDHAAAAWKVGARLADRYVLRRFIGAGGMGQVWLAFDEVLDKEVALKRVRADVLRAGRELESLRREVLLAQTVTHVNVCRIYDLEPIGTDWVIKMEVVRGQVLADILRDAPPLPLDRARTIARQLADGLAAVHAVGVVHRDLKPHNILVTEDGRAVLMDFGIARADAPTGETDAAQIVGTPEYMAPEQARGLKVDGRADLYALGCVLYRMLAGQVPFPAPTRVAAMARHLSDAPPDVRKVRPEVPAWLARLTLELMAKDADQRPPDAATVSARLAGPPSRWRPATVLTVLAPLLVLALVVGAVAAWRQHNRAVWQPSLHPVAAESDEESLTFDLSPDGKSVAFDARRNNVWRVYAGPVDGGARAVTPEGYLLFNWSADGRALFVHDAQFSTYRVDTADGRLELVGRDLETITDCGRFGLITLESRSDVCPWCNTLAVKRPDGTREILREADSDALVRPRIICDAATGRVAYAAVRSLTTGKRAFDFWLHSLATTPAPPGKRLLEGVGAIMPGPFAGPDTLVVVNWDGDAEHLWELRTDGSARRQLTFAGRDVHPVLAGDKRALWFDNSQSHSTLFAYDIGSGRAQRLTFGNDYVYGSVPSHDGRSVAILLSRGAQMAIVLHRLDGGPDQTVAVGSRMAMNDRDLDGEIWFQSFGDGNRAPLQAVSMNGGAVRRVMEVPAGSLLSADDTTVRLLRTDPGGATTTITVPRRPGGVASEEKLPAPWLWLNPAPRSGWRAAAQAGHPKLGLFAPGAKLAGTPSARLDIDAWNWSQDGSAIVFERGGELVRRELASGHERVLAKASDVNDVAESSDGRTLYYVARLPHVKRMAITNFGERPPL